MAGVPVRLSAQLAEGARSAARVHQRSLTEQVEHWARLGRAVEAAISLGTVERLKALSHDARLPAALAAARTPAGRRKAAHVLKQRGGFRYGIDSDDPSVIVRIAPNGTRTRGRFEHGKFVATSKRR